MLFIRHYPKIKLTRHLADSTIFLPISSSRIANSAGFRITQETSFPGIVSRANIHILAGLALILSNDRANQLVAAKSFLVEGSAKD
jgi:hypothetical protein